LGEQTGAGAARITVDDTLIADNGNMGVSVRNPSGIPGTVATLDVIRSTLTRNKFYGADVRANSAPSGASSAVMTVVSSVVTENGFSGIAASGITGTSTAFVSGNTIAGNVGGGIKQIPLSGVVHTRSNNAGEQTAPTSGTVTVVPGF
jgi:hypothetical protein